MSQLLEYKCPGCGASVEFNTKEQNMKCPYCDTEFDVDALDGLDEELKTKDDRMEWTKNDEVIDDSHDMEIFDPEATWKTKTVYNFTAKELLVPIFKNGKVCDMLAFQPVVANPKNPVMSHIYMNNSVTLCKYFNKRENVKSK